jgi:hypothetical protein
MIEKILSTGQTKGDQAGWRAAATFGVPSGGWMPHGFWTEQGPRPGFAVRHGATELTLESKLTAIESNVRDSDATLWVGDTTTQRAQATVRACHRFAKPCLPVYPAAAFEPAHVADWIELNKIKVLHVASNRESDEPGVGQRAERFLDQVLERLGHRRA